MDGVKSETGGLYILLFEHVKIQTLLINVGNILWLFLSFLTVNLRLFHKFCSDNTFWVGLKFLRTQLYITQSIVRLNTTFNPTQFTSSD